VHIKLVQILLGVHLGEQGEQDEAEQAFGPVHEELQGGEVFSVDRRVVFLSE
jgi:hypothetical protein